MNTCYEIKTENLKDLFYLFGIITSFLMSFVTIVISIKNRKNSLRESLYKEQLNFMSKLTFEFYHLHSDLTRLKNEIVINNNEMSEKIEKIFSIMFSNTHIGSDELLIKSSQTLNSVNEFLNSKGDKNKHFDVYFTNYKELINIMRSELGVNKLSKENQKLFK